MILYVQVAVLVLATLHFGSGHNPECGFAVVPQEQLREEIRREVSAALEQPTAELNNSIERVMVAVHKAVDNITANVKEILKPFLDLHTPGKGSNNPAISCKQIKTFNPRAESRYYWVETSDGPAVQVYCEMDKVCLGERIHSCTDF